MYVGYNDGQCCISRSLEGYHAPPARRRDAIELAWPRTIVCTSDEMYCIYGIRVKEIDLVEVRPPTSWGNRCTPCPVEARTFRICNPTMANESARRKDSHKSPSHSSRFHPVS